MRAFDSCNYLQVIQLISRFSQADKGLSFQKRTEKMENYEKLMERKYVDGRKTKIRRNVLTLSKSLELCLADSVERQFNPTGTVFQGCITLEI